MKNNIRFAIGVFCFMILFAFEGVVTQPRLYPVNSHLEIIINAQSDKEILLSENDFLGYDYDLKLLNICFVLNNQGVKKLDISINEEAQKKVDLYKNGNCLIESINVTIIKQKIYFKNFKSENELKAFVNILKS